METLNTAPVAPIEAEAKPISPLEMQVRTALESHLRDYYNREMLAADTLATPGTVSGPEAYQRRVDVDGTVAEAMKMVFSTQELLDWISQNEATYDAPGAEELPRVLAEAIMGEYLRRATTATYETVASPMVAADPEIAAA